MVGDRKGPPRSPEPMQTSRRPSTLLALPTALLALSLAGVAAAQEETKIKGLASVGYSHSFQTTSLDPGGSFNDGNGMDVLVGFQAGEYLAFLVGWQWQSESDFDTHFFPVELRAYSPPLFEDRLRFYGQFGIGLLYTRLHNEFNDDNERASAVRAGLGAEIGITENISGLVYSSFLWGLGSADDYDWGTAGVGLQYEWGL
jgi:hypothetical protein